MTSSSFPLPTIPVLDHGFVRLIDHMGDDLSVVRAARVSYNAAWRTGEDSGSDRRLIKYLWKNKHSTPFEAVTVTFEIKAPIFVLRQWHRHRTWSYNELSARYKELPEEFYLPDLDVIGYPSQNNKQGREMALIPPAELEERIQQRALVRHHIEGTFKVYRKLLAENWPRELARAVLPVATYSHMFATVNLLNLFKFLALRTDAHAQYEIREYANAMLDIMKTITPVCVETFLEGIKLDEY